MATSHSVWGYCPSHKRNQLAILPLATLTPLRDWSSPFVVSVVFSHIGCWYVCGSGWDAVDRGTAAQARILDLRLECLAYVCVRVCVRVYVCVPKHWGNFCFFPPSASL